MHTGAHTTLHPGIVSELPLSPVLNCHAFEDTRKCCSLKKSYRNILYSQPFIQPLLINYILCAGVMMGTGEYSYISYTSKMFIISYWKIHGTICQTLF